MYISCHGAPGSIFLGDRLVSIERLADTLRTVNDSSVIYFATCSTPQISDTRLYQFLDRSNARAIFGYRKKISWFQSAAFEIIALNEILSWIQDGDLAEGPTMLQEKLSDQMKGLYKSLGFRMAYR